MFASCLDSTYCISFKITTFFFLIEKYNFQTNQSFEGVKKTPSIVILVMSRKFVFVKGKEGNCSRRLRTIRIWVSQIQNSNFGYISIQVDHSSLWNFHES